MNSQFSYFFIKIFLCKFVHYSSCHKHKQHLLCNQYKVNIIKLSTHMFMSFKLYFRYMFTYISKTLIENLSFLRVHQLLWNRPIDIDSYHLLCCCYCLGCCRCYCSIATRSHVTWKQNKTPPSWPIFNFLTWMQTYRIKSSTSICIYPHCVTVEYRSGWCWYSTSACTYPDCNLWTV